MKTFIKLFLISLIFTSCSLKNKAPQKKPYLVSKASSHQRNIITHKLNEAVIEMAEQLFLHSAKFNKRKKIALTSFVNLDKFKNTSTFGRAITESLINELHIRNFNIIDLRTQRNIGINKTGEFYLTRDIKRLKKKKEEIYILVGTYSRFDHNALVLNARMLNVDTSEVISTARVVYIYSDCQTFNLCNKPQSKMKIIRGKDEEY